MFKQAKIERTVKTLHDLIFVNIRMIDDIRFKVTEDRPEKILHDDYDKWNNFKPDARWGEFDSHTWFYVKYTVPDEWNGKTIALRIRTGLEGEWDATNPQFLFFINGNISQAFDTNHNLAIITDRAEAGGAYEFLFWGYSGPKVRQVNFICEIGLFNYDTERLYYDLKIPLEVANILPEDDIRRLMILKHLNRTVDILDLRKPYSEMFSLSVKGAINYIEEEFYNKYCSDQGIKVSCVGHTHIDVAWLWRIRQTKEKAVRSFSTALKLMNEYEDFIFMYSQPVLYKFIKEEYPSIYAKIKERIRENRWEAEGAMWLESDINLPSGESLIRQILFGKRFFKDEFGIDSKILWLPDAFGFSASLPQIIKKSGIRYFMTTKISWNQFNKFPYDTFLWRGIDGSEVLTHFITTSDYNTKSFQTVYNSTLTPSEVLGAWKRYQQKDLNQEVLICYGYGDGGGGPTREMLENAKRMSRGIPGCPQIKMEKAGDFFKRLEKRLYSDRDSVPRWVGELYLELHRGTYTSMAKNKRFNRKAEVMLSQVEFTAALTSVLGYEYPAQELRDLWEKVLLNQFHDILPGSSIKEVYEDSWRDYAHIFSRCEKILSSIYNFLASKLNVDGPTLVVFNNTSFNRKDIVRVDSSIMPGFSDIVIADGEIEVPHQKTIGRNGLEEIIFLASDVPSKGFKSFRVKKTHNGNKYHLNRKIEKNNRVGLIIEKTYMENRYFKISFNEKAEIISLFDKVAEREIIVKGGRGNVLQVFEDKPQNWDSWDIDPYYIYKMWEVDTASNIEIVETGPIRGAISVEKKFLDSTIKQKICIYNDIPRVDFENTIEWREKQLLLKVSFPVNINSTKATYDIQFGNIERPTHWNTSWDRAKFEVCAHKWADLSENDYGVSLLNDCKYGYDIKDSTLRLTLIKSGVEPNPEADLGKHVFTYSLYPHTGSWREGGTVQMAYNLNYPMNCFLITRSEDSNKYSKMKGLPDVFSMISLDKSNIIVETVKKSEDDDSILVRLYENHNKRGFVNIQFGLDIDMAEECDLMENKIKDLKLFRENTLELYFTPYEIKTIKVMFKI